MRLSARDADAHTTQRTFDVEDILNDSRRFGKTMKNESREELQKLIYSHNARDGTFPRSYQQLDELDVARDVVSWLEDNKIISLTDLRCNPDDPPDCLAFLDGCTVGIEITELADPKARYDRIKMFEEMESLAGDRPMKQWPGDYLAALSNTTLNTSLCHDKEHFLRLLDDTIQKKDRKLSRSAERMPVYLVIFSRDLWLDDETVSQFLEGVILRVRNISGVFFQGDYVPGGHPIRELRITRIESGSSGVGKADITDCPVGTCRCVADNHPLEDHINSSPNHPEARPAIHPAIADARAVLFDFDFTLADSSKGVVVCMNHALSRLGLPAAPADAIRRTIGLDLTTALGELAGEEWKARAGEFFEHFTRKADEVMVPSTFFLTGAARVLRTLHGAGVPLGVVSTKHRHRVDEALARDGLLAFVDVVVGSDDVPRPKPAPDGLIKAAGTLGIAAADCVYVGDSEVDARAAAAAGMEFVAVLSGTTPVETFSRYPARAVLAGVAEIVPARS